MNRNGSKIEIFMPFGEAFELMKRILFQPFDIKKWLVIGFAAWLANLGGGGGGGGFNYPDNRREGAQKLNDTMSQIPQPVLITGVCILVCFVLGLIVLFAWLRARGRFIFVDASFVIAPRLLSRGKNFVQKETDFSYSHCSCCSRSSW